MFAILFAILFAVLTIPFRRFHHTFSLVSTGLPRKGMSAASDDTAAAAERSRLEATPAPPSNCKLILSGGEGYVDFRMGNESLHRAFHSFSSLAFFLSSPGFCCCCSGERSGFTPAVPPITAACVCVCVWGGGRILSIRSLAVFICLGGV